MPRKISKEELRRMRDFDREVKDYESKKSKLLKRRAVLSEQIHEAREKNDQELVERLLKERKQISKELDGPL